LTQVGIGNTKDLGSLARRELAKCFASERRIESKALGLKLLGEIPCMNANQFIHPLGLIDESLSFMLRESHGIPHGYGNGPKN
jgi:hypothetical protein